MEINVVFLKRVFFCGDLCCYIVHQALFHGARRLTANGKPQFSCSAGSLTVCQVVECTTENTEGDE